MTNLIPIQEWFKLIEDVLQVLLGFTLGLIASHIGYRRSLRHERASAVRKRKLDFRVFLKRWRSEILNTNPESGSYEIGAVSAYQNRIHEFHAELERVRDCLTDTQHALAQSLGALKKEHWKDKPHDFIVKRFDEVVDAVA